jgi:nitroreductase
METLKAIANRYSTRKFTDQPVPKDVLEKIVDAGRVAPTARNEQPWEFVVITEPEALKTVGGMTDHGTFIADGTACIAVYCKEGKYYLEDGCAATENILVAATDLGVQQCWVAGDKKPYCPKISEYLGVPEGYKLVALIALGYEASEGHPKEKRPLEDVIHWEKW